MFTGIQCVSIAVRNVEEAARRYCEQFDLERIGPVNESPRDLGLRWQNLGLHNRALFELIEASRPDSAVARFLERKGEGVYQVRLGTTSVDATLDRVGGNGARIIRDEHWQPGLRRLGWIHPSSTHGVLLELVENDDHQNAAIGDRSDESIRSSMR
jgi:methylmalonyl-CoA/ethylmalonyl-CoA epimerase